MTSSIPCIIVLVRISIIEDKEIRIFKTRSFAKWAKKEKVTDITLIDTVYEIEDGLIDADLGGGLIKKRIAKAGRGKRGGRRLLLAFKEREKSVFIFGFSKNERASLHADETELYKKLAKIYLGTPIHALENMCSMGKLIEVEYEKA